MTRTKSVATTNKSNDINYEVGEALAPGEYDARGFTKKHVRGYDPRLLIRGKQRGGTALVHLHQNGTVFDDEGYDYYGRDIDGRDRDGWSAGGYDREGYNAEGVSPTGWLRDGTNKWTGTRFDSQGRDRDGYFEDGFNAEGYDRNERDRQGKLPVFSFTEIKRRYFVEGMPATLIEAARREPDGTWVPDPGYRNLGVQRHIGRMNNVDIFFVREGARESPLRLGKASDWSVNYDGHVVNDTGHGFRLVYAIDRAEVAK